MSSYVCQNVSRLTYIYHILFYSSCIQFSSVEHRETTVAARLFLKCWSSRMPACKVNRMTEQKLQNILSVGHWHQVTTFLAWGHIFHIVALFHHLLFQLKPFPFLSPSFIHRRKPMRHHPTDVLLCFSASLTHKHSHIQLTPLFFFFQAVCSTFSFCFSKWRENISQICILFHFLSCSWTRQSCDS